MRRARTEFENFHKERAEYNEKKSRYNASLRLQYTNWVSDLFNMRPGQLFTFGELNAIFPQSEKIGASEYARPEFPFAIYNPLEYFGPKLDDIGYDQIKFGFGKPMATLYNLETGDQTGTRLGKNYKNFGVMGVLLMTDAQKEVEGNYN